MSQAPDYHPAFHSQPLPPPPAGQHDQQMVHAQPMPSDNPINDALLQQWLQWQQVSVASPYPLPQASTQRMEWRYQQPTTDEPLQQLPPKASVDLLVPPLYPSQPVAGGASPTQAPFQKAKDLTLPPDFDYERDTPKACTLWHTMIGQHCALLLNGGFLAMFRSLPLCVGAPHVTGSATSPRSTKQHPFDKGYPT